MQNTNYPPPPPYSPSTNIFPIGFDQPPQQQPHPIVHGPPPLNSAHPIVQGPPPLNSANVLPAQQVTYVTTPLVYPQPTIAALNSTPRPYQSFRGIGFRDRKAAYVGLAVFGVVFLVFLVIFLVVFFTIFNKASKEFDEAAERHKEFKQKYFPENNW